jgi:hypothetical protein
MPDVPGEDAAYPEDITKGFGGVVCGYFGGPNAFNVWAISAWLQFRSNPKVPIWVAGYNGTDESKDALAAIRQLGLPKGCPIAVDMENRVDDSYLLNFAVPIQNTGYPVLVYGSVSTVFRNRQMNGYWVADWTGQEHMAINPDTGSRIGVRGTQWAEGPLFDSSAWKQWVTRKMWL